METIAPLNFSLVIAYLLPGFVSLYSLTYLSTRVKILFDAIGNKDSNLGSSFIIIISSLACGVIISAIRALILDQLQEKTGIQKPPFDYSKLKNEGTRKAFNDCIPNTWRYTQSYGNMFIALSMLLILKIFFTKLDWENQWHIVSILAITVAILFFCHRNSLNNTYKTINDIL